MSRLASFKGPSTPSKAPVQRQGSLTPQQSPSASANRQLESTFHRKTRTLLQELQSITETWDDLVLLDGLKAARKLIDTRTELENSLSLLPDRRPKTYLVHPKVSVMENCISELDAVLAKLKRQFTRMNAAVDGLEAVLVEAYKQKGWKWVSEEPLWVTWPLAKFVTAIPDILILYHRSLEAHVKQVDILRKHSTSFDASRDALNQWIAQEHLEDAGWPAFWEDLCEAEVDRWDS